MADERFSKPLDIELFTGLVAEHDVLITVEQVARRFWHLCATGTGGAHYLNRVQPVSDSKG
ncbi:MAG: hypothetical protein GDA36_00520 [Rhodobacteraceae bacterium]|nr:hypothetical protein [Paracoccaceae bacterium]